MTEVPNGNTPDDLIPGQLPPLGESRARWEAAEELRTAQRGWLERRGILEDTTHLTMTRREYDLLKDVGLGDGGTDTSFLIGKHKESYGIPSGARYASVDIVPDDPSLPSERLLVDVTEADFGTSIDEGRLESHGIEPGDTPHLTMTRREFDLFRISGIDGSNDASSLIEYARDLCGVPRGDQYAPQYALIDIESGDPNLPNEPLLVDITEADFGTSIDRHVIDKDFQNPNPSPDSPLAPEGDAYVTVDITEALTKSWQGLQTFATELMKGRTSNPLSGSFWMRAGGLANGQRDAYVWENGRPVTSAVELTIAFPGQYDSVCAVVGDRRDPANGKLGMAQIENPAVMLTIEGENLRRLQEVYRDLYRVPDFALSEEQRRGRDEQFNNHVFGLISEATRKNQAREIDEAYTRSARQQPKLRERQIPRS